MFMNRIIVPLQLKRSKIHIQPKRNIQVSIIGASDSLGAKVALKLKQNPNITKLKLYDFDENVKQIANDLDQLPYGPPVVAYSGDDLLTAITMSHLILAVGNSTDYGAKKNEIAYRNAPNIKKICQAMAERNTDAILGISTQPVNSIVPFACAMLKNYNCFNPFKVFGFTGIDVARAKTYAAQTLKANPRHLTIPVIGGRSVDTTLPLFSNLIPEFYVLDEHEADRLTRLVRKADILFDGRGRAMPSSALAWSISDSADKVIDALSDLEVDMHCYSANPSFGTRFFAGPVTMNRSGICKTNSNFSMSQLECKILSDSIEVINKDLAIGEQLVDIYTDG